MYVYKLVDCDMKWTGQYLSSTKFFTDALELFLDCLCSCFVSMLVRSVFVESNMSLSGQTAVRL